MEFEFEAEKQEPTRRLDALVATARSLFRRGQDLGQTSFVDGIPIDSSDIASDMAALEEQEHRLAGEPGILVDFPWDSTGLTDGPLSVPVDLGLTRGNRPGKQLGNLRQKLRDLGLKPRFASRSEIREAFYDRAAETLGMRAQGGQNGISPPNVSIVSSTNAGDNILCAKGWFLSTGTIVGQSTCPVSVKPGRYSLGVSRGSRARYHEELFLLPISSIHLDLP